MKFLKKILKYRRKPLTAFLMLFNILRIKIKKIVYVLKYKVINKNISIGNAVRFHQKTILTGKGTIILKNNISIGYKLGGFYWNGFTEIQARYPNSEVIIAENVAFNNSSFILAANRIVINSGCKIGANVTMMDFEAHGISPDERDQIGQIGQISIGRNVWIGNNVVILKNANIGNNSIVAANSVVLKGDYPENCIIGGNPAKVVKNIPVYSECEIPSAR